MHPKATVYSCSCQSPSTLPSTLRTVQALVPWVEAFGKKPRSDQALGRAISCVEIMCEYFSLLFLHPANKHDTFRCIMLPHLALQAGFLHSMEWQRFTSLFALGGKHKSLSYVINHADCLLQHCQENDPPRTTHQYLWHLSKSSGHAYLSAFREVSMCKHSLTIFRVTLAVFITFLSVHAICHVMQNYQWLYWSSPLCIVVFRAWEENMFGNCQKYVRQRPEFPPRNYCGSHLREKYRYLRSLWPTKIFTPVWFLVQWIVFLMNFIRKLTAWFQEVKSQLTNETKLQKLGGQRMLFRQKLPVPNA